MNMNLFQNVKDALQSRLDSVVANLLPGGRIFGREYVCGSLEGGMGESCRTNLENGVGSDFATGDKWGDVIGLASLVWNKGQYEAARELAERYDIESQSSQKHLRDNVFIPIFPVPQSAPQPPIQHPRYGGYNNIWRYENENGQTLYYTARFDLPDGKVVLPLCYGRFSANRAQWFWKAFPEPRPLYGLANLSKKQVALVLLVEGEKTADVAQKLFPDYAVMTWSGGAMSVAKADLTPLHGKEVVIWPDNDTPGFQAAIKLAKLLDGKTKKIFIVQPPEELPNGWDLADNIPENISIQSCLDNAVDVDRFSQNLNRVTNQHTQISNVPVKSDPEELNIREWPQFSVNACPGILGDFVRLATRESEADPAAVCVTTLVRFCAEVYGFAPNRGPHIHVGETIHPPRLFAVICGNSSKARKGTSRYPVIRLFGREFCDKAAMSVIPLPARESGGPLSTGEGLAYHARDLTDAERQQLERQNQPVYEKGDKRLIIIDEEFASGLTCTKREGNTLSMGLRCFWDSGDYSPLTKNNPVAVKGAHINIITHITIQELSVCLGDVQAFNGFGNRFLWICARRSKLVALPARMPDADFAPIQREWWKIIANAQKCGELKMTENCLEQWKAVYPDISQEHIGLVGSIINRAEAQTLRLSLVYALMDGKNYIAEEHLNAALALWRYAQESAFYIFGDRAADPLEAKVLEALKNGPLSASELSAALNRNTPKDRLLPVLRQLEAQRRIVIQKKKGSGRPSIILSLNETSTKNEINENNEKSKA